MPDKVSGVEITSTMIDGLALHNGPAEKPELALELNRLVPLFPAPKSLSVEYAFLHGLPDPLRADLFAGLSLCVEIDHFFGRVRRRKAS